ncbi:MAG: hypothetical protein AB7P03_25470 [Kofleriaceae bacterium]
MIERIRRYAMRTILIVVGGVTVGISEAPATVAEQRARLPPAAECDSPIAGTWRALTYSDYTFAWYQHTLEIQHDQTDPTQLTGMHYVEYWRGGRDDVEPPARCLRHQKGKMTGTGTFRDGEVAFFSGEYELVAAICGENVHYNPDNFTGRLEPERQEFQAVNNDGGNAVNEPTVFRRIRCVDEGVVRDRKVDPPAFFPKRRTGGC